MPIPFGRIARVKFGVEVVPLMETVPGLDELLLVTDQFVRCFSTRELALKAEFHKLVDPIQFHVVVPWYQDDATACERRLEGVKEEALAGREGLRRTIERQIT